MRIEKAKLIGTGVGRTRLEFLDNGCVQIRERVRAADDPLGPYHRAVITPDNNIVRNNFLSSLGLTNAHLGAIRSEIAKHRTPERLEKWELNRAANRDG